MTSFLSSERAGQVQALFDRIVELDAVDRTAYLDEACRGDPDLRREVESLLAAFAAHGSDVRHVLGQLLLAPQAGVETPPLDSKLDPYRLTGQTISHYQVLEKLGGGGMGVVYKALDEKLDRTVALKFLPPHLSMDAESKARFIHEAKAASALDHANICTIYDIDETEQGQLFIAMAFYQGETLKAKIARRPFPLEEALAYAIQVADGLSRAHDAGIVHRDVKPANVMITDRGRVKIVDFGLAKVAGQTQLTQAGTTLGTVAYMSPEQARGEVVDARTDIWSLGVVLYEMVTGQTPFRGDYQEAVLYAIQHEEPEPLTGLRTGVPPALEHVVMKCLAKDPAQRYQHVDEVPVDLRALETTPGTVSRVAVSSTRVSNPSWQARWKQVLPWGLAALMALVATWALMQPTPETPRAPTHLAIPIPPDQQVSSSWNTLVLSPDGTLLVYRARRGDITRLYLRPLDQFEARALPGTEGAYGPFFSPDGKQVGFLVGGMLKKVPVTGGVPLKICDTPGYVASASWGPDNTIVFGRGPDGVFEVSAAGGTPRILIAPDSTRHQAFRAPQMLPGGKAVLFTVHPRASSGSLEDAQIIVQSLETGQRTVLVEDAAGARYLPTGHLIYRQEGGLMAMPFDLARRQASGAPISILDAGSTAPSTYVSSFAVSENGILVYLLGRDKNTLMLVDREGRATPFAETWVSFQHPRFSPDGRRVVVASKTRAEHRDIWVYDVERGGGTRITHEGDNFAPLWTPDGEGIMFTSSRSGSTYDLHWIPADGSGEAQHLLSRDGYQVPGSWTPEGHLLAFYEGGHHPTNQRDILVLSMQDSVPRPFLTTSFNERAAILSPDSRWLAYTSDESERDEVYVRRYPGAGGKVLISTEGGYEPVWAPGGRELFYRNGDTLMVVAVETEPAITVGKPRKLFEGSYFRAGANPEYDISPDGKQFVMIREEPGPPQVYVVHNWFDELERLVPTEK